LVRNQPGLPKTAMRRSLLLLLSAAVAVADPKPGDEGTPGHQKAADLVKQLGHPRYATREAAAKELLKMGGPAIPALAAGTKAADEEVRTRSAALLPKVRAGEWKKRADAYLADVDGKQKHDLPLLAEFEKLTGPPTPASRKLFAEMVRANGELLHVAAATPDAAPAALRARCQTLTDNLQLAGKQLPGELGDLAAVYFVGGRVATANADWRSAGDAAHLLANPTLGEAIGAAEVGPAVRRLLVRWAETRPKDDLVSQQHFALAVRNQPFPEAVQVLVKLAKSETASMLNVRAVSIDALSKIGDKDAKAALEGMMGDATTMFRGFAAGEPDYRLGDCAFAARVAADKKNPADYGMAHQITFGLRFGAARGEIVRFTLRTFQTDEDRQKALKKWTAETKKD
ncbi:MAG TPA: HEAT repeat domain-containing protein, partial [Gemmataceae bacterium]|nr:HEAT repeat domain-containing protein [Gemmataceae bacterium]